MVVSTNFSIREGDLSSLQVRSLLTYHLSQMHATSPPGSVFALDLSGLQDSSITCFSVWDAAGNQLVGIGALKSLPDGTGEVKAMRTHPDHLRKGVAALLLDHIITRARSRAMWRLSLETGSGPAFEPALAMYRRRGFVNGEAFGGYEESAFNQFLHLEL